MDHINKACLESEILRFSATLAILMYQKVPAVNLYDDLKLEIIFCGFLLADKLQS